MRSVEYAGQALRDIRKPDTRSRRRVEEAALALAADPLLGKKLRGEFEKAGLRSYRAWPFRIIYGFDRRSIRITTVDHRRDVYR